MMNRKCAALLKPSAAIFLLYIVSRSEFFRSLLEELDWIFLVAGLAVQPIVMGCLVLLSIRHLLLLGSTTASFGMILQAMVLSHGLNLALPVRLSELLKATYLRDHAKVPLSRGLSAIALERLLDLLIVAALALLATVKFFGQGNFASVLALGLIAGIGFLLLTKFPGYVLSAIDLIPIRSLASQLEAAYLHLVATTGTIAFWQAVLLGLLIWGLSYLNIFVFLSLAGSIPIGLSGALLVFVMTTLGGAIPALPGGLGTYEAAAVIALRSLGYSFDEAMALALVMHAAQLALPFLMAMLLMLQKRLGILSLISDIRRGVTAGENQLDRNASEQDHGK
jgi:uncharacterized membrane protein YbhN (UPF0104 family)